MDKINFVNGDEPYISASNLNKMQDNAEKAISEKLDKTSKATSTEAIAGTNNTKYTTPYSVKSAIDKALEGYTPSSGKGGDTLPIGTILPFGSDTIPNGWLLCDGSVVSRTTYAELFNVIGLTHVEDGFEWLDEERFPLPDMRKKIPVGKDERDTDFDTIGKTGGEKEHKLTASEMATLTYDFTTGSPQGGTVNGDYLGYGSNTDIKKRDYTGVSTNAGDQPHNNMQPYLVTNYIIKAKMTVAIEGEIIQQSGTASETNAYSAKAVDNKLKTNIITGEEVATNEYIDGKRVYVKRETFTTPSKIETWGEMITIPANSKLVNTYQVFESENQFYPFPFGYNNEGIQIYYEPAYGKINVKINFAYASNKPGYIIAKYTKNE